MTMKRMTSKTWHPTPEQRKYVLTVFGMAQAVLCNNDGVADCETFCANLRGVANNLDRDLALSDEDEAALKRLPPINNLLTLQSQNKALLYACEYALDALDWYDNGENKAVAQNAIKIIRETMAKGKHD